MRKPYVGEGAEGARRSAAIDRSEAEGLDPGPYRDSVLSSEARWLEQAEALEAAEVHEGEVLEERVRVAHLKGCTAPNDHDPADSECWVTEVVDAEVVLSPREQAAQRLVAIAALEQLVRKLKAEHREQAASVYDKPHMKDPVMLDGRELGQARTDAVKAAGKVADAGKWLAYVTRYAPAHLVTETITTVDPTWQAHVLKQLLDLKGEAWFVDPDTGVDSQTPPPASGLEYTPAGHKLVVTAAKDAAQQVTHLLGPVARQLGLPELEAE
jgi:hypothetical protein